MPLRWPETTSPTGTTNQLAYRQNSLTDPRLAPHEDQWTDVILLAHSMGGLVTAEVALLCRHRIIGTINFDVPFVGMHPGIVKAGLGSIFKPWPTPEERIQEQDLTGAKPSRMNTLFNPKPSDPNFNPSFDNDVHLPVRKGWENTLHWLTKHSNGLVAATKGLVQSHIEFGSAMADYHTLKTRYAKIRALEEDDIHKRRTAVPEMPFPPRLRFVNYYTASTGRPKIPKTPKSLSPSRSTSEGLHPEASAAIPQSESLPSPGSSSQAPIVSPKISVEHHTEDAVVPVSPQLPLSATSSAMQPPLLDLSTESTSRPELPEIPPIPQEPAFVDLAQYDDKAQRKVAEKEHKQALKDYQQAVKARNKVIKERSKIEEKWKKQLQKDQVHAEKDQSSNPTADADESDALEDGVEALDLEQNSFDGALNHSPYGNYDFSRSAVMNQPEPSREASVTTASTSQSTYTDSTYSLTNSDSKVTQPESDAPAKKKRLRKFCMLPPKDGRGNKDPTWVRVFMENIDEVTAHTTLFFVNDTYEQLVGDVGARIEDWVCEADSLRVAREMDGME